MTEIHWSSAKSCKELTKHKNNELLYLSLENKKREKLSFITLQTNVLRSVDHSKNDIAILYKCEDRIKTTRDEKRLFLLIKIP